MEEEEEEGGRVETEVLRRRAAEQRSETSVGDWVQSSEDIGGRGATWGVEM